MFGFSNGVNEVTVSVDMPPSSTCLTWKTSEEVKFSKQELQERRQFHLLLLSFTPRKFTPLFQKSVYVFVKKEGSFVKDQNH